MEEEIYLFHTEGHDSNTALVWAKNELEARGKAQKELITVPEYKGPVKELIDVDNGVMKL